MDGCGAWLMRAFVCESGKVLGFYHAETACDYNNSGQTRKSGAYSVSFDGGKTFYKPNYPYNQLVDSDSPIISGKPTGEGDFSVVLRGDYYYLFFANVEQYYTGVARSSRFSEAYPGSFYKYFNGSWNSPAVGGKSSELHNIGGPQAYVHTPSQSIMALGNFNPYWNRGFLMSVSDDAINWSFFADPITTPDPVINKDQFMYPSLLGQVGGYDIGNTFQYFYMWIPPGYSWNFRYQIFKDVKMTYVGKNSNEPSTKVALTTFRNSETGETWQSTEFALAPYKPESVVGYIMTRPYPNSFPVYDCFNKNSNDHFVGTVTDCFLSGSGVEVTRILGYVWSIRTPRSVAVYQCHGTKDLFLSTDSNCEGRAPAQTVPFGYIMSGPGLSQSAKGYEALIPKGSKWRFYNRTDIANTWNKVDFDDSKWQFGVAPFGAMYSNDLVKTYFGRTNHYFRSSFNIPAGNTVKKLLLSIASDNYAVVYLNGILVDSDPLTHHEAAYWNRKVYVDTSVIKQGLNQVSVVTYNLDDWSFFDLELTAKFADIPTSTTNECNPVCINGQCIAGKCKCDYGWKGTDCGIYNCKYSDAKTQVAVPSGSSFRYTPWIQVGSTPSAWFAPSFVDSSWHWSAAPFGTDYYPNRVTTLAKSRHLYRKTFSLEIPEGKTVSNASLYISTDDTHRVYINGKFVGVPIYPYNPHMAKKWNDIISIDGRLFINGVNLVAVEVPLVDGRWTAYFDMELVVTISKEIDCTSSAFAPPPLPPTEVSAPAIPSSAPSLTPLPLLLLLPFVLPFLLSILQPNKHSHL